MLEKDGIIYEILQNQDLLKIIECVVNVFPISEPLTKSLEITQEEFYPFAEIICQKALEDRLSHVAKDIHTGEVIGFRISNYLFSNGDNEKNETNQEKNYKFFKFQPIIFLLEQLEQKYLHNKILKRGQILHLFMLGVDARYRNRNIAKYLIKENIEYAKKQGFSIAICEATGTISQHNAFKLGFTEIVSINYQDYEYQGMKVFANITSHQKCMLMEKIL